MLSMSWQEYKISITSDITFDELADKLYYLDYLQNNIVFANEKVIDSI